jgi:hypothetical protein
MENGKSSTNRLHSSTNEDNLSTIFHSTLLLISVYYDLCSSPSRSYISVVLARCWLGEWWEASHSDHELMTHFSLPFPSPSPSHSPSPGPIANYDR